MTDYEREQAIKEAERNQAEIAHFDPRPHLHNDPKLLNLFGAGFDRGWDAGRAPLLERIAELEAKLAQQAEAQEPVSGQARFRGSAWTQCTVEHVQMVQANPEEWKGGYEVRLLFARPQPAQLQRLSEEEVREAVRAEGMMYTAPDLRVAKAIQSALAAKNGAELK